MMRLLFVGLLFALGGVCLAAGEYTGPSLATLMLRTFFVCVLFGLGLDALAAVRSR